MEKPIVIENLVKIYKGGFRAVDSLTLEVPQGTFMGFLGPNGAGKTTTIKILTNMLRANDGTVQINGVDALHHPKLALADVGAVVETPEFYPYLTPIETLQYLGRLRGMSPDDIKQRSAEVLELVKMTESADKRIGSFSKGMKQRIAIAQAVLHQPRIVILDEPTSGLDPRGMAEVRDILKGLRKLNYTIFMSSHLLNEVQEVCTDVALINKGKLLRSGKVEDLVKEARGRKMEVRVTNSLDTPLGTRIASLPGVRNLQLQSERTFSFETEMGEEEQANLLLTLQGLGLRIVSFKEAGVALESLYLELIADSR